MSRNYMSRNDELRKGDFLESNNRKWKAIFQDDGNFVIYGPEVAWASNTDGSDVFRLCMQADGNLVMYNQCGTPIWETGTTGDECNWSHLQLTDDGKLVVCRESNNLWSSAKSKSSKK